MSYATVQDVQSNFPRFVPNQAGSISDAQIQVWLNDASSQLHSGFFQRGINIDNLTQPIYGNPSVMVSPIGEQQMIMQDLVRSYGVAKLGMAIFATLGPAEQAIVRGSYNLWQNSLKMIAQGFYDFQFAPGYARMVDISPGFQGVAGAEAPYNPNPWRPPDGLPRSFWKDIVW